MTPEQEIKELKGRVADLEAFINSLNADTTIPLFVALAFKERIGSADVPDGLVNAPITTISDPTGGVTVDAQSRIAINAILDGLVTLGLMQ